MESTWRQKMQAVLTMLGVEVFKFADQGFTTPIIMRDGRLWRNFSSRFTPIQDEERRILGGITHMDDWQHVCDSTLKHIYTHITGDATCLRGKEPQPSTLLD